MVKKKKKRKSSCLCLVGARIRMMKMFHILMGFGLHVCAFKTHEFVHFNLGKFYFQRIKIVCHCSI